MCQIAHTYNSFWLNNLSKNVEFIICAVQSHTEKSFPDYLIILASKPILVLCMPEEKKCEELNGQKFEDEYDVEIMFGSFIL